MENLKNHRYNEVQSSDRVPPEVKIMNDYWIKDLWPLHKDLVVRIMYFGFFQSKFHFWGSIWNIIFSYRMEEAT